MGFVGSPTCVRHCPASRRTCCREQTPLARDWKRRRQLEEAANGPPAHLAEGFGRFNPPDFARFAVIARSSLMEAQNHLLDAVDRGHISEERREGLNALAETALQEVTGLLEYLQSPQALRNARRAPASPNGGHTTCSASPRAPSVPR